MLLLYKFKYFEFSVVSKTEFWGNLYYQTVKLGIQRKLYEQNYNQMILAT